MASILEDIFGAITGQQSAPQQTIIPTNQLLGQAYGTATGLLPQVGAYNSALVNATLPSQLQAESMYDPNAGALRAATSRSILDELNLGGNLGDELQDQVIRNALEGNAATGFGVGQGGRGLVARDLGLTSLDLAARRRAEASGAVRGQTPLANLFNPDRGLSPSSIAGDIRGVQAKQDELANLQEDIRRQNFSSLLNTGGRILGTAAGAAFGVPGIGGAIGGNLITGSGVRGVQRPQAGAGNILSILSGLFGGAGALGRFSGGAGQLYGNDAGEVMTSTKAQGINLPGFETDYRAGSGMPLYR